MKLKRLVCLMVTGLCLSSFVLPPAHFAASKNHWALSTLETLQKEKLLLSVSKDSKILNGPISTTVFDQLLSEIWSSEFTVSEETALLENSTATLTRKEAAEQIYSLFNKNTGSTAEAIDWIKSTKIMNGYPSGDFKPADKVTLAQGVSIMSNLKNYLKDHPDVKLGLSETEAALHQKGDQLTFTATANLKGTLDFTLRWGEKSTGGYSVKITNVTQSGKELRISYRLNSPAPGAIVTQALTYPKDTVTLEMGLEAYKQLTIILVEDLSKENKTLPPNTQTK